MSNRESTPNADGGARGQSGELGLRRRRGGVAEAGAGGNRPGTSSAASFLIAGTGDAGDVFARGLGISSPGASGARSICRPANTPTPHDAQLFRPAPRLRAIPSSPTPSTARKTSLIKRRERFTTIYMVEKDGKLESLILLVRGYGLGPTLWLVALKGDLQHRGRPPGYQHAETPGLGGEVDNPKWKALWPARCCSTRKASPAIHRQGRGRSGQPRREAPGRRPRWCHADQQRRRPVLQFWLGEQGFGPISPNSAPRGSDHVQAHRQGSPPNPILNNKPGSRCRSSGICSALAVTSNLKTAVVMSIALTLVTACSSMFISMIRSQIPSPIRMIVQMVIIASLVIVVDQLLRAYAFSPSKQLSVFVGLIITNCIVMGRAGSLRDAEPAAAVLHGRHRQRSRLQRDADHARRDPRALRCRQAVRHRDHRSSPGRRLVMPNGLLLLPPSAFFLIGLDHLGGLRTWKKEQVEKPAFLGAGGKGGPLVEMEHLISRSCVRVHREHGAVLLPGGMCSFIAIQKVETAIGLGVAVVVVQAITVPANNLMQPGCCAKVRAGVGGAAGGRPVLPRPVVPHRRDRGDRADPRDAARQVHAQPLQRARHLPAADHGQLRDHGRLCCSWSNATTRLLKARCMAWARAHPGRWRSRRRRHPREAQVQRRARGPAGPGHHLHHHRPDVARLHVVLGVQLGGDRATMNTEIILGIGMFTAIVLALTCSSSFARSKLVSPGDVTIDINGEKKIVVPAGGKLLQTLAGNGLFLPSACGGGGTCAQCKCVVSGRRRLDAAHGGVPLHQARRQGRLASVLPDPGQAGHEDRGPGRSSGSRSGRHRRVQPQRRHLHQEAHLRLPEGG